MDGQKGSKLGKKAEKDYSFVNQRLGVHALEYKLQYLRRVKLSKRWMQLPWNLEIDTEIRQLEAELASAQKSPG
jgi:hypothetical protein